MATRGLCTSPVRVTFAFPSRDPREESEHRQPSVGSRAGLRSSSPEAVEGQDQAAGRGHRSCAWGGRVPLPHLQNRPPGAPAALLLNSQTQLASELPEDTGPLPPSASEAESEAESLGATLRRSLRRGSQVLLCASGPAHEVGVWKFPP